MNTTNTTQTRPQLETLACVNERCESYGQVGRNNLIIRKIYGKDQIRYLCCRCCGAEFSERKHTALWNTKVSEAKAVSVAEHLAEGCSLKATARLAKVHPSVVTRLNRKVGIHAEAFHDERMQGLEVVALQHWLLVVGCWRRLDRSLHQAAQVIHKRAFCLLDALNDLAALIACLDKTAQVMADRCYLSKRAAQPLTFQGWLEGAYA